MPYFGDEEATAERVKRYLKDNCRDEDGTALSDARLTELVTDHQPILDRGIRLGWFASYTGAKVADEAGLLWGGVDKRTAAEVADYTALAAMVQRELPGFRAEAIADPGDGEPWLPIRRLRVVHDGWGYTAVIRIAYAHDRGLHIRLWRPTENVSPHCGSCQCGDDELSFAYQLFDLTGPQPRRFFRSWLDGVTHLGAHAAGEHARDQCPGDPGPDCTVCPDLAAEDVMP